jgi:hypothetical protein
MIMRHDGRARIVRAAMSGQVDAGSGAADHFISDVEAIPPKIDFGDVQTSQPVIAGVVLRNTTSNKIDINAIYIEAAERAGYSLRSDCASLDPGQACLALVTWSAVLKGSASGVLVVEHTGPTKVASVNLSGTYNPPKPGQAETFPEAVPGKGLLVASAKEVDFGANITTTSAMTVSLVNIGDAPLNIKNISLANSDDGLSISKKGCGEQAVLDPVEACPLTITWSPVRQGAILDDVQISHDGARGVLVLPVRGTAGGTISQDSKAVKLAGGGSTTTLSVGGAAGATGKTTTGGETLVRDSNVDPASVLDGFVVTSHSANRAIISGPGGSRIVINKEDVVIGGFVWNVIVRPSGVEFISGNEKVLLLFDRSLASVNKGAAQSGGSNGGKGSAPAAGAASSPVSSSAPAAAASSTPAASK